MLGNPLTKEATAQFVGSKAESKMISQQNHSGFHLNKSKELVQQIKKDIHDQEHRFVDKMYPDSKLLQSDVDSAYETCPTRQVVQAEVGKLRADDNLFIH